MRITQSVIPVRASPLPITILWSDSADLLQVPYIRCLNGRMTKAFELWDLAEDGVREVHLYARVKLLDYFREDTFYSHFFNAQIIQIYFLGRRALNASVEFIDVVCVTQHIGSCVDYTPNIFVYSWGVKPTDTITANVSTITRSAYDPICYFHGFVLRSNQERLRLK